MLYLATVSFSGKISMAKGKVGEISDQSLADDLIRAGYLIPYEATDKGTEVAEAETSEKPKSKRKVKAS